jgi:Anti-sigma-K factor rskA, C-terminal
MTDLDHLSPQSRAVLSLILKLGKGFEEIAEVLHMDHFDVRARAHAAALALVPPPDGITDTDRSAVLDYLLGEESVSARVRVRGQLRLSGQMREWALALEEKLAPLAVEPLPTIPPPAEAEVEERPRRWRLFFSVLTFVVVGGVVVLLAAGSGTARHPQPRAAASRRSGTPGAASNVQTLRRLVLAPTNSDRDALGAGAIVRQDGSLLLMLQARGLAPNHGNSYAVWLFNNSGDARLLGFVSPQVGTAGTFSSGVTLPDDAIRFHSVIVTRESSPTPVSPGQTVLHSPLSLS